MALPILAATALGSVVAGLTQFFASRAGLILAGLGLTFIGVKGFEVLLGTFIQDISIITSGLQAAGDSLVAGPLGQILTDGGDREGVHPCELSRAELLAARTRFPFLADRVPERT